MSYTSIYKISQQVYDDAFSTASGVVITASSMSGGGYKNPSARLFYLDPDTFLPLDYDHYFLNLTASRFPF